MTSVNYPTTYGTYWNGGTFGVTSGPIYTYSFDSMSRPIGLTDQNNYAAVSSVQYGPPNQLLSMNYFGVSESRTYNTLLQLTNVTIPGQLNLTYNYPTGTNNGKISSQTDAISGETVTYQYDSLNHLISASGSGWNQDFGYDGFGNLVSKSGSNSPPLSISVNAATNQIRVWKGAFDGNGNLTSQEAYFYGVDGQKLGTYSLILNTTSPVYFSCTNTNLAVFFRGKRVAVNGVAFGQDRLGSNSQGKFFPYGEDRGTPIANDQVKFATYTRDSATGLDYADQRYYSNQFGRFMTPDPYWGSASLANPQSLNRLAYVLEDPVNHSDPWGLCAAMLAGITMDPNDQSPFDQLQMSLGGVAGFPYNMSFASSLLSVLSQGTLGPNPSTAVALATLRDALNNNAGSIDVIAYSGGAQAFATALAGCGKKRVRV